MNNYFSHRSLNSLSKKLLVVDDDPITGVSFKKMLPKTIDLTLAENGVKAFQLYTKNIQEETPFDGIVMDLVMPAMDGISCIQLIKQWEEEAGYKDSEKTKIIVLTSQHPNSFPIKFVKPICDSVLYKPITKWMLSNLMLKAFFSSEKKTMASTSIPKN